MNGIIRNEKIFRVPHIMQRRCRVKCVKDVVHDVCMKAIEINYEWNTTL